MKDNSEPPSGKRVSGTIADLERNLPPEWWKRLFNALYLKAETDLREGEAKAASEVDAIVRAAGLKTSDRIIDLSCGQGRHALELSRRGFQHVVGVDRSRYLIRLARRRARRAGLKASFQEGDPRKLRFEPGSFDCVLLLGNSISYFEQESDHDLVLKAAGRLLRSDGRLVMQVNDGAWTLENFEPKSWDWIDGEHLVCRERSLSSDGVRLVSREVVVRTGKGIIADQLFAERLYSEEQLFDLLEAAGFADVVIEEESPGASELDQDHVPTARRLFVTARSPEVTLPEVAVEAKIRHITVLMGDRSMPDLAKRGGRFNPEDIETIDIMQKALSELDDFEFSYFDDHESLILQMKNDPPAFVLNLCDEGYRNDAFKELHIPAYLEMLGIPYSGAGPACLALCYDKSLVRAYAMACDIPVPAETYVDPSDFAATIATALPALVKPNTGDSSVGITKDAVVHSPGELIAYLDSLRRDWPGRAALIQEFLTGEEFSVGLVGNPGLGFTYLPVLQVDYSELDPSLPKILGYESKWIPESPYWHSISYREADIADDQKRRLYDYSALLFERLHCRDYARFDYRTDSNGVIKLLEVNPNPGWSWDGKMNLMAGFAGLSYAGLLDTILAAALDRVS